MKEVIRKLALDSGLINYIDNETPRRYFISGDGLPDCEKVQRFAELLVRECARVAALTECPYTDDFARQTYGHTWDMACVESAKDIRKHFGVIK